MAHIDRPAAASAAKQRLKDAGKLLPSERFRALREALELTQELVAEQMGVSGPAVNDWENGHGCPKGASPYLIQAWTMYAAEQLMLPGAAVILATEWLTEEQRAAVDAVPRTKGSSVVTPGGR